MMSPTTTTTIDDTGMKIPAWLRQVFVGRSGERRLAHIDKLVEKNDEANRELRAQLKRLRAEDDPMAALVRNVKSASFSHRYPANH